MSLLNDALRDLDRATTDNRAPISAANKRPSSGMKVKRFALPAVAVSAALVWLAIDLDVLGLMPEPAEVPQPIALNSQWLQAQSKPAEASMGAGDVSVDHLKVAQVPQEQEVPAVSGPSPAKVTLASGENSSALRKQTAPEASLASVGSRPGAVAQLLASADQALQRNQLLTPIENNAHQLYRSVLVLEPNNTAAVAGIEQIQQRYLQWAQAAVDSQRSADAQRYVQRARQAGASVAQIAAYGIAEREAIEVEREPNIQPERKKYVRFDKDLDLAQRLRTFPLGQYEHKAWLRISSDEPSLWTAMALADAYAAQRDLTRLEELLTQVGSSEPAVASYIQAQWHILKGELGRATLLLEAHRTTLSDSQYHLRLLAGVRTGGGDYGEALPLYGELIQLPEFNLNDWLGYAVALERVNQPSAALQAYQKISRMRHSDRRVNDYIQTRISDLTADVYR